MTPISSKREDLMVKNRELARSAVHVIEKSAYDELQREVERLQKRLAVWDSFGVHDERDQLKEQLQLEREISACLSEALEFCAAEENWGGPRDMPVVIKANETLNWLKKRREG